jgi:hypothetical protein
MYISDSGNRRTENIMAKRKSTTRQTMIYKKQHTHKTKDRVTKPTKMCFVIKDLILTIFTDNFDKLNDIS